uniref:CPBP family intramembrane glutamic endopeptidase n=1 Tax=Fulvivirga sp. TaxID=1931237 RepID=UPI00404A2147
MRNVKILRTQLSTFVLKSFLFSWVIWIAGYYIGDGTIPLLFLILGTFGPAISALLLASKETKPNVLVQFIKTFRSSAKNYWMALLIFPLFLLVLTVLLVQLKAYKLDFSQFSIVNLIILLPVNIVLGGALGEEIGWRGYLLKKLQLRYSDFYSSLIVGLVWSAWHLPLFLTKTYENPMLQYFAIVILMSFVFTFISNRSPESIWPVVMLHASFNVSNMLVGTLFPETDGILEEDWYYFILILILIVSFLFLAGILKIKQVERDQRNTIKRKLL